MTKLALADIGTDSFQSIGTYNSNNELIEAALQNTLSRDGTGPNAMGADFDMNSFSIINLPSPVDVTEAATKGYVDDAVNDILAGTLPDFVDFVAADEALRLSLQTQIDGLTTVTVTLQSNIDANTAAVTSEASVRATADSALASRLDIVEASVESPNTALAARVTAAESAIVDLENNSATATSVSVVESRVTLTENGITNLSAVVSVEETARTDADAALSSRLDVVEASVESPNTQLVARVTSLETAVTDLTNNQVEASRVLALETSVNLLTADLTTEETSRIAADTALSSRVSILEASSSDPNTELAARVTVNEAAVLDLETNKAEAFRVTTLETTTANLSSSVTTNASSITGINGQLAASYGINVDANGRVASLRLLSDGTSSEIAFNADTFKVYNGASNQAVFTVEDSLVKINGGLVVNDSLGTGALSNNAVTQVAYSDRYNTTSMSTTMPTKGGQVLIWVNAYTSSQQTTGITVTRNGTTIDGVSTSGGSVVPLFIFDTPAVGNTTYAVSSTRTCNRITLSVLELRK